MTTRPTAGQDAHRRRSPLDWLAFAYLVFVVIFGVWTSIVSFADRVTVPIVDDWRILDQFYSMPFFEWLFSNQNGHRTAFTFGLFALDYAFFDGRQDMLVVASLLTAWLAMGVLYVAYRGDDGFGAAAAKTAFGFACFATFWAGGSYNFLWGVCQGNLMVVLWLFLSLACLVGYVHPRRPRASRWPLLVLACATALFATFSLAEGIGTWVAVLSVAIVARLPLRVIGAIAGSFALTMAMYSVGLESTGKFSLESSMAVLLQPIDLIVYVVSFLGSALGRAVLALGLAGSESLGPVSGAFGTAGLVGFAAYALWLLRRRSPAGRQELLALGITAFVVGAAAVAALARVPRAPLDDAVSERFVNWSALFWTGGALAMPHLVRGVASNVAVAVIVVLSLGMIPAMEPTRVSLLQWNDRAGEASLGVLLGLRTESVALQMGGFAGLPLVTDAPELVALHARPARLERFLRVVERLSRDRRSFFSAPWANLPGAVVGERFDLVPARRCRGNMAPATPLLEASKQVVAVRGWAEVASDAGGPARVVVADEAGIVRGLGALRRARAPGKRDFLRLQWTGYLTEFDANERYVAYLVLADGRSACPLAPRR